MMTDFQRPQMLLLILALIGNAVGHTLFLMTFPALGRTMGLTDVQSGLVIGVSALMLTVSAPFWGWYSERRGRRPVVIVAMLVSGLGLAVSALVAFVLMLVVRLVYALLSGGLKPAAQAIMADVSDADTRARSMGLMGAAFGVGALIGGALAHQWYVAGAYWLAATLCLMVLFIAWRVVPRQLSMTTAGAAV